MDDLKQALSMFERDSCKKKVLTGLELPGLNDLCSAILWAERVVFVVTRQIPMRMEDLFSVLERVQG